MIVTKHEKAQLRCSMVVSDAFPVMLLDFSDSVGVLMSTIGTSIIGKSPGFAMAASEVLCTPGPSLEEREGADIPKRRSYDTADNLFDRLNSH